VPEADFSDALSDFVSSTGNDQVVYDSDGELKFVILRFTAPLISGAPYSDTHPLWARWEAFVEDMNALAPAGVGNAFQTAGMSWCFMMTERSFVSSLVTGMALAMGMAFAVLLLATQNWIVASYATLSIMGIVACVLGSAKLQGWQLGIAESISGVILIGFSVDYVVHISELYVKQGLNKPRVYKVTQTLKCMGISIVAGAITTFGSGLFLFFCTITFFEKFAILICLTISMSLCWSLGFLSTLLIVAGPEHGQGSIKPFLKAISGKFTKGKQ